MQKFGYLYEDSAPPGRDFTSELRPMLVSGADGTILDLRRYCTPSNQLGLSSCSGNACADSVEIVEAVEEETLAILENRQPRPVTQLSRLFVYTLARNLRQKIAEDGGSYIRDNFEVLSRYGICSEAAWPYLEEKVYVAPSLLAMREAAGHRIHEYYQIRETGEDRVVAILAALRGKHPVVFGTDIIQAFLDNVKSLAPVPRPVGTPVGGHAMIIVGHFPGQGFLVRNSWGVGWGDNGYCVLSEDYITWDGTRDLWVPTLGARFLSD